MSIADDLERLQHLRQAGALSETEFQQAKEKLLAEDRYSGGDSSLEHINLYRRSTQDRWLGGVCGGLARFRS